MNKHTEINKVITDTDVEAKYQSNVITHTEGKCNNNDDDDDVEPDKSSKTDIGSETKEKTRNQRQAPLPISQQKRTPNAGGSGGAGGRGLRGDRVRGSKGPIISQKVSLD